MIKKGVFLAVEAWRRKYGGVVKHAALRDGGGGIVQHIRPNVDAFPLLGWTWINDKEEPCPADDPNRTVLRGPGGEVCMSTTEAFDCEIASKSGSHSDPLDRAKTMTFLQKFLNEIVGKERLDSRKMPRSGADQDENGEAKAEPDAADPDYVPPNAVVVTTSPLEDYLWRGDHPIPKHMSLEGYAMWVYRIEKLGQKDPQKPRFIDIPFSSDYKLHGSHLQRLASEFRVPRFEGFIMPSNCCDSETAALYKQLLLRPLSVELSELPEDVREKGDIRKEFVN